jgi:hypothetical protein
VLVLYFSLIQPIEGLSDTDNFLKVQRSGTFKKLSGFYIAAQGAVCYFSKVIALSRTANSTCDFSYCYLRYGTNVAFEVRSKFVESLKLC